MIDFLTKIWHWFVDSGLAEKTADTIGRIISFDGFELDELMWDWINII